MPSIIAAGLKFTYASANKKGVIFHSFLYLFFFVAFIFEYIAGLAVENVAYCFECRKPYRADFSGF